MNRNLITRVVLIAAALAVAALACNAPINESAETDAESTEEGGKALPPGLGGATTEPTDSSTDAPPTEDAQAAEAGDGEIAVTLENDTGSAICSLFVVPMIFGHWGSDTLAEDEEIAEGDSFTLSLDEGSYKIKAEDCDGDTVSEQHNVIVEAGEEASIALVEGSSAPEEGRVTRRLDIWAIYPDGRVRFATLIYMDDDVLGPARHPTVTAAGSLVFAEEDILSLEPIGGNEHERSIESGPFGDDEFFYPLITMTRTTNGQPFGLDMIMRTSPYIVNAADFIDDAPAGAKILSLGLADRDDVEEVIVAVALPPGTEHFVQKDPGSIEEYGRASIGDWVVYYFEVSGNPSGDAIRIHFVPGGAAPEDFDVYEVDDNR